LLSDKVAIENDDVTDVESKIVRKDENRRLFEEVTSLPQSYKEVIILFYYHQCDTAEISRTLNIAEGTVRSRLHRGREILKRKLGGGVVSGGQNEGF
jgi:RNA polymerase sigma-70 factor (ECF subfamily)